MKKYFTEETNFYGNLTPRELLHKYGSPLYVYNENVLRQCCRDMKTITSYSNFKPNYSIKANSNLKLINIIKEEGLSVDAVSEGEVFLLLKAGFNPDDIFFVANNISEDEMKYAIEKGVLVSVDSLSQLKQYGRMNPNGNVSIRFNAGIGAGHHDKVITGGKKTKFGINEEYVDEVKQICKQYSLTVTGINQHIGSLFMEEKPYIKGVKALLDIAEKFPDLEFVDMGGGFGIPYHKQDNEKRLDIQLLSAKLTDVINEWVKKYGKEIEFKSEPGRYVVAESGVLLGRVYAVKENSGKRYVGTDIGFNNLIRPAMYDSYHDVEVYNSNGKLIENQENQTFSIVGNICESGDIIANDRKLPTICEGDIIGVMDAGAYGYSMSSNYNSRMRPAEVLIRADGSDELIRRRDTLEDLLMNY